MTTPEQAVFLDATNTWNLNNFDLSNDNTKCTCADKLHVWIHLLNPERDNANTPDYKLKKAKEAIPIIINKANECLVCGHVWSSTNCKEYVSQIEKFLKTMNIKTHTH